MFGKFLMTLMSERATGNGGCRIHIFFCGLFAPPLQKQRNLWEKCVLNYEQLLSLTDNFIIIFLLLLLLLVLLLVLPYEGFGWLVGWLPGARGKITAGRNICCY
jgi:predicted nucleic acid-binding Zn ribbon protein